MTWKRTCLFVAALVLTAACPARPTPTRPTPASASSVVDKVWMHLDGPWQSPPPDLELKTRTAPATLFRLSKNGEFSLIRCYVIEQADKSLLISSGDGQVISIGTWKEDASGITATYRLVDQMVEPVGGTKYPGPDETRNIVLAGGSLRFDGKLFDVARFAMADYEEFIAPVRTQPGPPRN